MEEDPCETCEQAAKKVCHLIENKLELPNVQLERAHRVGQHYPNRLRPIIARFTRFSDREAVKRNVSKPRGSRIYVNEDLCPASQEIKRAQLPQLKQAKSEGKIGYFRRTKLIIKDKTTNAITNAGMGGLGSNEDSGEPLAADVGAGGAAYTRRDGARGSSSFVSGESAAAAGAQSPAGAVGNASGVTGAPRTAGTDRDRSAKGAWSSGTRQTASPVTSLRQDTRLKRSSRK